VVATAAAAVAAAAATRRTLRIGTAVRRTRFGGREFFMRSGQKAIPATSLLIAVLFVSALAQRSAAVQEEAATRIGQAPKKAECVFVQPSFSGKCRESVEVTEKSTAADACAAILECLNDVRCTKTYCSATTIRGGWKLESSDPSS
jgi:hypothetical protein